MSTTPPTSPSPAPAPAPAPAAPSQEVLVISHSPLLYWWPVWACGFLMAAITWMEGSLMSTLPPGTTALRTTVTLADGKQVEREVMITPENKALPRASRGDREPGEPVRRMSERKELGVIFFTVLLLVIFITNVPLRGIWSVMIIIGIFTLILIFALAGVLDAILSWAYLLDVRINLGGYLFVSTVLFILWALTVMVFDRRIYIVFTPGNFRVCTEIGAGEKVYDTMGLKLERQPSDLFRHYLLGLGAGDLIVKTSGATNETFDLHNVLWVDWKVQRIEEMLGRRKSTG